MIKSLLKKILLVSFLCMVTQSLFSAGFGVGFAPGPGQIAGDLTVGGSVIYQTDKYIVCDVYTSTGINACIDLLGSEGGEVYLPEGTYTCTTAITIDYANTTLTGSGKGTILDASGTQASPAVIDTNDMDYVTIRNLSILGDGSTITALIGDNDDSDNLTVSNCYFNSGGAEGIHSGGSHIIIENNNFTGMQDDPVFLAGDGDFSIIKYNKLFAGGASAAGIRIESQATDMRIIGNYIDSHREGIVSEATRVVIKNNIINDSDRDGIAITGGKNAVVEGNIISNGADGYQDIFVAIMECVVKNNILLGDGAGDRGIKITGDYNIISGNYSENHDVAGIQEDASGQNNLIYGNNIQDSTPYIINGTLPEAQILYGDLTVNGTFYYNASSAEIAMQDNTDGTTVTTSTSTFVQIEGTYTSDDLIGFTVSGSSFTYTGLGGANKKFKVDCNASLLTNQANTIAHLAVYKNGTKVSFSASRKIAVSGDEGNHTIIDTLRLSQGDIVQIRVSGDKSATITAEHITIIIHQLN